MLHLGVAITGDGGARAGDGRTGHRRTSHHPHHRQQRRSAGRIGCDHGRASRPGRLRAVAVTVTEYNDGDTAFTPPGFPGAVEVRASVYYPTSLAGGPRPLIVLMHGRHSTCYSGSSSFLEWPCGSGRQTIPSFQGYNYLAENLASWGYIVVSVSANGINARDNSVTTSACSPGLS